MLDAVKISLQWLSGTLRQLTDCFGESKARMVRLTACGSRRLASVFRRILTPV